MLFGDSCDPQTVFPASLTFPLANKVDYPSELIAMKFGSHINVQDHSWP